MYATISQMVQKIIIIIILMYVCKIYIYGYIDKSVDKMIKQMM